MAYKRTSFNQLSSQKREYFAGKYKFSKVIKFEVGSEAYVIPLGLETGYYETPCHRVDTHKVNGQEIGLNGSTYSTYIKCGGVDENGNRQESLCCQLAQKCKEMYPNKEDFGKRIIGASSSRVQLPVLILGNSLKEQKPSYPVSKVSILNDLHSEAGLKFAYIDMSSSSFAQEIVQTYGKKLKEDSIIDYDMDENSDEYLDEVRNRLTETVIKVQGYEKKGFKGAMKKYSFFPFSNPAVASQSPEGEREAILKYKSHKEIAAKINEFLTLFDVEVDNIISSCDDKTLQEYFNSAMGLALKSDKETAESKVKKEEEKIEIIQSSSELEQDDNYLDSVLQKVDESADEIETSEIDFEYSEDEGDFFSEG